jgi:hypothetical protein
MSIDWYLKGLSDMHATALTQVQAEGYLPQIQPRSPSLAQQRIHLLQQVLVFEQQNTSIQAPESRPRGRPPLLSLQQWYLALLLGVLQQTPHLSTICVCNAGCACHFVLMCWRRATPASCSCWKGWPLAA